MDLSKKFGSKCAGLSASLMIAGCGDALYATNEQSTSDTSLFGDQATPTPTATPEPKSPLTSIALKNPTAITLKTGVDSNCTKDNVGELFFSKSSVEGAVGLVGCIAVFSQYVGVFTSSVFQVDDNDKVTVVPAYGADVGASVTIAGNDSQTKYFIFVVPDGSKNICFGTRPSEDESDSGCRNEVDGFTVSADGKTLVHKDGGSIPLTKITIP